MMRYLFVVILRGYQLFVSPLLPSVCRFHPSCSSYAIEAFESYGVWIGMWTTLKRIVRCQPFCSGGYDPVK